MKKLLQKIVDVVRIFFTEAGDPINLAVFRIVFFVTLFYIYAIGPSATWYSQLPAELIIAPAGLGWLLTSLPINESIVGIASVVFMVCCVTGLLGLFSRTSSLLTFIVGFYVLGVPQFYGKVDHIHHLLWFAAILAVSRSGDVLSLDAVIAAWKKGKYAGAMKTPDLSRAYSLPLRFVWLLIGIIYLFPGLWKIWNCGLQWVMSDNLKYHLYSKWLELEYWEPFFRLDQYPLLFKLGALWTIAFEVSFLILILFKRIRPFVALAGIIFHESSRAFMKISFFHLYVFYVTLFDWASIFRSLGKRLFKTEMYVVYDGNCTICKRTIGSLKAFDVFGRIVYVNALDRGELERYSLGALEQDALLRDMHVVVGNKILKGFYSYRGLSTRIPILWLALPFLWIWPVPFFGNLVYRRVADHRACELPPPFIKTSSHHGSLRGVWVVGIFLLLVNGALGFRGVISAWPFACYPTFAWLQGPENQVLEMTVERQDGGIVQADFHELTNRFGPPRFWWLVRQILWWSKDEHQREERLRALWQVFTNVYPDYRNAVAVSFYEVTLTTIPEERSRNPLGKKLIYEMPLAAKKLE